MHEQTENEDFYTRYNEEYIFDFAVIKSKKSKHNMSIKKHIYRVFQFNDQGLSIHIGPGLFYLNKTTANVLATSITNFINKLRYKDVTFNIKRKNKSYTNYKNNIIINCNEVYASGDICDVIASVFKRNNFYVFLITEETTSAFISFMASSSSIEYGLYVSRCYNSKKVLIKFYSADGKLIIGSYKDMLNEEIKKIPYTEALNCVSTFDIDVQSCLQRYFTGFDIIFSKHNLYNFADLHHHKRQTIIIACRNERFIDLIRNALQTLSLIGVVIFYSEIKDLDFVDINRRGLSKSDYKKSVEFAESVKSTLIILIDDHGESVVLAHRLNSQWKLFDSLLNLSIVFGILRYLTASDDYLCVSSLKTSFFAERICSKYGFMFERITDFRHVDRKNLYDIYDKLNGSKTIIYVNEKSNIKIHDGLESSAIHFIIIVVGYYQKNLIQSIFREYYLAFNYKYTAEKRFFVHKIMYSIDEIKYLCHLDQMKFEENNNLFDIFINDRLLVNFYIINKIMVVNIHTFSTNTKMQKIKDKDIVLYLFGYKNRKKLKIKKIVKMGKKPLKKHHVKISFRDLYNKY